MKKTLLIDGQIFQTEARDRGMGRYSARLVNSIVGQKRYDEVRIVFAKNGHTNHLSDQLAKKMFPSTQAVYLELGNTLKGKIDQVKQRNKKELNQYITELIGEGVEIDFLIPSPFQEPVVSVYPDSVKKLIVFYDLIPYLYHKRYEPLMPFENYLKRFDLLFDADMILAISQSVQDDLITYLGLLPERIAVIDGAAIRSDTKPEKPAGIAVPQKYILMPTSDDPRKNNLRAVIGFEEFRSQQTDDYKLIITSKIHQSEQRRLELFSSNILFTGNIKEEYLDWLYAHASAVLFVPESEGLGLPVLEAVHAGKKVVCSDLNVFKEISKTAFYYCDHEDQRSIAGALIKLIQENLAVPDREYKRILNHYSWDKTGERAVKAIHSCDIRKNVKKRKIAILAPRPDGLSAVGKVVAEGHAALSEVFDIDYYAEKGMYLGSTRPNFLQYVAKYHTIDAFSVEQYSKYDAVFYHIGNSDYHVKSIANELYLPGYVILHDTNITEAYRIMFENNMISASRYEIEQALDQLLKVKNSSALGSVVYSQNALIGHSKYALKAAKVNSVNKEDVFIQAELPTNAPLMSRERKYEYPVVGLAGILAGIKGVRVIEGLAGIEELKKVKFKLFGYDFTGDDTVDRLSNYENISVSTNLTDFDFQNNLSKLDIFVNYRLKYQGETSLSTLEAMRYGVVVIVRNVGWYAELPDSAVVKADSEEDVKKVLLELINNPEKLRQISKNAIEYVQKTHTHKSYADVMKKIVEENIASQINNKLTAEIKSGRIRNAKDMLSLFKKVKGN